ncbi:MAG: acetyl xylan esterase [Limisphaerales bacterium]|nr:MAG: acetyl xylan esterase [Limisphaerales bacterium]KAG0507961.1 MAG: acetyl xylan esterase [Limisphaerales bacterium]TXT48329.1 MAG: acetyl xylan esterase [Limisphaerales bacterium]
MRSHVAVALAVVFTATHFAAAAPRALPAGQLPNDARLAPPKDLNGYFPFTPPKSKEAWPERAAFVQRQMKVALGLWPMPTKTPLNAVIHGKTDKGEYTVEKVYFESAPGFFVTGNLYRPKGKTGKVPAVLFAHGHWKDARLSEGTEDAVRKEISIGAERFEEGGRSIFQSMCVQLARMGCVVWQWDMMSDSDAVQLSALTVHRFAKQRPDMAKTENWELYSAQAEANLQSIMGLQTLNAIRSLDFVLGLPEVDPARIAVTGASGGGTQTMILAGVDPRITLSFPAVMVSTAMQGGCTCENASLLRVNTGNIEFAALAAPRPQGMTTANDWTREMVTKGFPELVAHYKTLGAPNNVMLHRGEHFQHNYNAVARSGFYTWVNQHFKLGFKAPVVERDYQRLTRDQLTVWDSSHPAPKADDIEFERKLLRWWRDDAEKQLQASAASVDSFRQLAGNGVEAVLGRTFANAGKVAWELKNKADRGNFVEMTGLLRNETHGEELPVAWLYPKKWNGRAVVWLDDSGKAALFNADGSVKPEVKSLVDSGATVLGADLLFQGEFTKDGQPVKQNRVVANPREFAGYTYGYNHALFAQRAHDVLTLVKYLRSYESNPNHPAPKSVDVAGFGGTGPIVAAARAVARGAIDRAAVETAGFRFGKLTDYRDVNFLPGGAKYGDVPGLLALNAPGKLWVGGETAPALAAKVYAVANAGNALTAAAKADRAAAAKWLLAQ